MMLFITLIGQNLKYAGVNYAVGGHENLKLSRNVFSANYDALNNAYWAKFKDAYTLLYV
jgi:hypothetical protein